MSLFFQNDQQLTKSLDELPESYTREQIKEMAINLINDMKSTSNLSFASTGQKVMHYSENHKQFCLSFPMLFRGIVKGSFTENMLDMFLNTKFRVSSGEITEDEAKNNLVDAGVTYINSRK